MIPIILVSNNNLTTKSFLDNHISQNQYSRERVFEVVPLKKEIVLSQVKDVLKKIIYSSNLARLFIFFNFDTAASESQNALLKSLEENSAGNHFILVVKNEYSVLPTVRSRSRIIRLVYEKTVGDNESDLLAYLKEVENSTDFNFLAKSTLKKNDREHVIRIFDSLLLHYRKRLISDQLSASILSKILNLRALILANNLNPQLAYDNLLIFISKLFTI